MGSEQHHISMHKTNDWLVVPIQCELSDEVVISIRRDILTKIKELNVRGVLVDVSGIMVVDSSIASFLIETTKAAHLLGVPMVTTGLKPGIVSALLDLDIDLERLHTTITIEKGFDLLHQLYHQQYCVQTYQDEYEESNG